MLGWIVDKSAYGADVFAAGRFEYDFAGRNDLRRIVEIDNAFRFEAFQSFRRVSSKPNCWTGADERAGSVERLAGSRLVFKNNGEFVLIKRGIRIGYVAVNEIEKPVRFDCNNAVAFGVSRGENIRYAVRDALGFRELIVRTVGEGRNGWIVRFNFVRCRFVGGTDNLRVRKGAKFAGVICVFVSDEDF